MRSRMPTSVRVIIVLMAYLVFVYATMGSEGLEALALVFGVLVVFPAIVFALGMAVVVVWFCDIDLDQ